MFVLIRAQSVFHLWLMFFRHHETTASNIMDIEIAPWDLENDDDDLVNELIETNPSFRAMLERSKASPRKSFDLGM